MKLDKYLKYIGEQEHDQDDIPDADVLTQMGEFADSLDVEEGSELEDKILGVYDAFIELLTAVEPEELDEKSFEEFIDILDALDIDPEEIGLDPEELKEAVGYIGEWVKKWVIRKGKKKKRLPPRKGYKVKDDRYVKMSASEKAKRSRGSRKGARKAKTKLTQALRKRKKSKKKRKTYGIQ